jgi:hypothetical protein
VKRISLLLALLVAGGVFAQEIGSEIPPPASPYDNPYAPNPNGPKKDGAPPAPPISGVEGAQVSAGKGSFGLRASFFGAATALPAASFGLALFATDIVKLTFDAGMSVSFDPRNVPFGFGLAFGIEPTFRSPSASARPFLVAQVGFGKTVSAAGDDFAMLVNVGGGGEYFFSPFFSMNIRALLGMPINFKTGSVGLVLFTPGVGATVYF